MNIHEQNGAKVVVLENNDLTGLQRVGIRLYNGITTHFMTVEKAIVLSNLIQKAVDQYYKEHPEKIYEQEYAGESKNERN